MKISFNNQKLSGNIFYFGNTLNPSRERTNSLPLNSDGLIASNKFDNALKAVSVRGGLILTNTIPKYSSGGYNKVFAKCLSNVIKTLFSDFENSATFSSSMPAVGYFISNPSFSRRYMIFLGTFSSYRSFRSLWESDIHLLFNHFRSIVKSSRNGFFSELREIIFNDFLPSDPGFKEFQYLPYHYSCSLEGGLIMADIGICNDVFIDFEFHEIKLAVEAFKDNRSYGTYFSTSVHNSASFDIVNELTVEAWVRIE